MKQNIPFTITVSIVFVMWAVIAFYYWLKINRITWKYRNDVFNITNNLSVEEKKRVKGYFKMQAFYFTVTVLMMFLLFFLQGTGRLF